MALATRFVPSHPPRVPDWVPGWRSLYGERLHNAIHGVPEPVFDALHRQTRLLHMRVHLVNSPAMIGHILQGNQANYPRPPLARKILRPFIGEGLLTAEGASWKLQRRIVAGAFTPAAVSRLTGLMHDAARRQVENWPARLARIDLAAEATQLTMKVIADALFAGDLRLTDLPVAGPPPSRAVERSRRLRPDPIFPGQPGRAASIPVSAVRRRPAHLRGDALRPGRDAGDLRALAGRAPLCFARRRRAAAVRHGHTKAARGDDARYRATGDPILTFASSCARPVTREPALSFCIAA